MTDTYALDVIVRVPDERLGRPAAPVVDFGPDLRALCERMVAMVLDDDHSAGLAAVQIGDPRRVAAIRVRYDRVLPVANPEIVWRSPGLVVAREGCFSLPGKAAHVARHERVTVKGRRPSGDPVTLRLAGLAARVAQHEVDHLDGVTIAQRAELHDWDHLAG